MSKWFNRHLNQLMYISGALIVIGIVAGILGYSEVTNITFIVATVVAIGPIINKAWMALTMKSFSIELLITIAVIGAMFIQEYTEAAIVTFLFLFGAYLEKRTLNKTRSSIQSLVDMAPATATVIRDGKEMELDVDEVEAGDHVIVRPGGKVPVDGTILSGQAHINEAAITGESNLRFKAEDAEVFSGSVLDSGYIELTATKVGEDTTFSKIIELVEEAQERKSGTEKFLNTFAQYYTPAIVVLAIVVYFLTRNLHLSITFLVIACPGALIIGAPVAYVAGIGNGAKNGALIKGGEVIDNFAKVDTVIFDKTGTLTEGSPTVTDITIFDDTDEENFLRQVANVEMVSEHHLGQTIVKEAKSKSIPVEKSTVEDAEAIKGKGVSGIFEGAKYIIGNKKLMEDYNIELDTDTEAKYIDQQKAGNTAIFVARDNQIVGILSIMDKIRQDAFTAIQTLRDKGVGSLVMLTGDNYHSAKKVSDILGLDGFHAELMPDDKMKYIEDEKERGRKVMMVGDGINDAPALAFADVGIAMGHGGTDIAMETADVVLMGSRMEQLAHGFTISKMTYRVMLQNTAIALLTVALLLGGVLYGYIHLASGMLIHEVSILLVILNAMRLRKIKEHVPKEKKLQERYS
ncbi:heavy metal translocating P-type ATPase [Salinicoccus roseus]|uniref:heavy metal translocating P-type ATPase n=1 Tax=Salinicoccus roseus TaxID=45670 RepID=UPI000F512B49|nr:heavy metal translocating P-type ATPase [Salinicoccus roseus]RPE51919.1 Cd2+/Zn2+-exporting ATPase [Salinicoccus roseus]GGA75030.1 haloacid dehalogenase [Salinicoccus roseus]